MRLALVSVLLVVAASAAIVSATDPCGGTFGSNTYSLNNFKTASQNTEGWTASVGVYKYNLGVCAAISDSPCSANKGGDQVQACQTWSPYHDSDSKYLGKTSPTPTYSENTGGPGSGVVMTVAGGSYSSTCKTDNSVVATFVCDASTTGTPEFLVSDAVDCVTHFTTTHAWACPGGGGSGNGSSPGPSGGAHWLGWLIFSLIIGGFGIYFVGGAVYKKQRKGSSGMEMVPHVEFWRKFPGYVGAGFAYTAGLITKPCRKGDSKSYNEI